MNDDEEGDSTGDGDEQRNDDGDDGNESDYAAIERLRSGHSASVKSIGDDESTGSAEDSDGDGAEELATNSKTLPADNQRGGAMRFVMTMLLVMSLLALLSTGVVLMSPNRSRGSGVMGFRRGMDGPAPFALPRSFGEAVARITDGLTTPIGLTSGYIPGCVVQMNHCHESDAHGLTPALAAVGFFERQSLFGVVSNSTETSTLTGCAHAAWRWHKRCRNSVDERVSTRFVDGDREMLCVYPPRGERFELTEYLRAAEVCANAAECYRIAACFERHGMAEEKWTREPLSHAKLAVCLPTYGQRLSWLQAGAFKHPSHWRDDLEADCEPQRPRDEALASKLRLWLF